MKFDICIPTCKTIDELDDLIKEIEYNTPEIHRLIVSCQPLSAARNRNYCLSYADSDIITMLDDDIRGFYPGWLTNLLYPIMQDKNIIMCSARLLDNNKNIAPGMGMVGDQNGYAEIHATYEINDIEYKRVTPAAVVFRKSDILFDENFIGSGYEDTSFMNEISKKFNGMKFIVNNHCKLIHMNESTNQGGNYWKHNHDYYCKKHPWDIIAKDQKCWVK